MQEWGWRRGGGSRGWGRRGGSRVVGRGEGSTGGVGWGEASRAQGNNAVEVWIGLGLGPGKGEARGGERDEEANAADRGSDVGGLPIVGEHRVLGAVN